MYSLKLIVSIFIIAITLFSVACRREQMPQPDFNNLETSSQSFKMPHSGARGFILASERLTIPAEVSLPADHKKYWRVATYYANGVQKYKAREKAGLPGNYEWVFIAPSASLYDIHNRKVGTHGAGPYWQISPADSIFAEQFVPARTAVSPDANSVDWLLLKPKTGKTPTGIFGPVLFIQRIATKGGKAPAQPPLSAEETIDVKYEAVYRFSALYP